MSASFLTSLDGGRLRWDELRPFPEQDPDDRAAGDAAVAAVASLVESRVDPERLDRTRELPPDLVDALRAGGYFKLQLDDEVGGLELSAYNAFRVIERAARRSTPVGQVLGLANGAGAGGLLPVLPAGPLRDYVARRVAGGAVSGWADTEPTGQNNRVPATTATRNDDDSGYVLNGQKVFTGNGPIADLLVVTAGIGEGAQRRVALFFVDTASAGFRVTSHLEFLGSRGLPNAALRFDGVRVPEERVFEVPDSDARFHPLVSSIGLVGRLFITSAAAMAIARQCLEYTRDFVGRRTIDGRPLGDYDQIQRIVAANVADVYAMESVVQWCLVDCGVTHRWYERVLAKNITTLACWRIVDRTMSLLGGEGFETADSKRRRGTAALPLERLFRDARGLRVAGNVDFQVDYQAARLLLARHYSDPATFTDPGTVAAVDFPRDADLTPGNQEHLDAVAAQVSRFTRTCVDLTRAHPDPTPLFAAEDPLVQVSRIASELFTMSTVLARTAHLASSDGGESQSLADVYCTAARDRLDGYWRRLTADAQPDYAKISRDWLSGTKLDRLIAP